MQYAPPLIPPYGPAVPPASASASTAGYYPPYYGYGHPPHPNTYGNQVSSARVRPLLSWADLRF